jgi:Protein of unknown function DUF262
MNDYKEELKEELEEELNIEDDAAESDVQSISRYDITSYGIDFDVEGIVKRIERGNIVIPEFQRKFVWKLPESSRFIESLLLGLPVPGIFLTQDQDSGNLLVIDGQQRILSLYYFAKGYFNPSESDISSKVFRLDKVQPQFMGKTYETLDSKDRNDFDNAVIHATVIKQEATREDNTSIYQVFERLNSGGIKLSPQEVRTAVYHGKLIDLIKELNSHSSWRTIYGKENERMKDQELILRFFAVLNGHKNYKRPMTGFVTLFCKRYYNENSGFIGDYANLFKECCDLFVRINNGKPFRIFSAINAAFFEAAMVGLATRIQSNHDFSFDFVEEKYEELKKKPSFIDAISQSTGDPAILKTRIDLAIDTFR